jgi:NAD+ diphosphatase
MTIDFIPAQDFHWQDAPVAYMLFFHQGRLLVKTNARGMRLPQARDLEGIGGTESRPLRLGFVADVPCWAKLLHEPPQNLPSHLAFVGLRGLFDRLPDAFWNAAGYGLQVLDWASQNRFCGHCGAVTEWARGERALRCTACRATRFPRVSPAIIVAVTRQNRLLLARANRFPGRLFSVIAGYVEPGETLEECVRREVQEEVGLTVGTPRYFGSQSWPFSGSLMVAFTVESSQGEICIDRREIVEADWFAAGDLPTELPGALSIARRLINWFERRNGGLERRRD